MPYYIPGGGGGGGGGGAAGEERVYYDTIVDGRNYYPITAESFGIANVSSAPRLVDDWTQFEDCTFEVENFTTGVRSLHTFPTLQSFLDWKNATIPYGGGPLRFTERLNVRPFDYVDPTIQQITRVYGINNIYNGMRRGRYKASNPTHMGIGNAYGSAVLYAIWAYLFEELASHFTEADFEGTGKGRNACWVGRSKTLYSMPRIGEVVSISGSPIDPSGRHSANENWESFNPLTPGDEFLNIIDRAYVYIEPDGSFDIRSYYGGKDGAYARSMMLEGNASGLTVFKLASAGAIGERQIAVLIKPMGIDRVWLPFFSETEYDMELVHGVNADKQPAHFRKVAWSEFNGGSGSSPHPNSGMFLNRSNVMPSQSLYRVSARHQKTSNVPRIYFRLRSKLTKKVSPVSQAHIEVRFGETNAPVKMIVLQD